MFYQVLIEISEKVGKSGSYKQLFELDKTDVVGIENDVVIPYLKGSRFQFDGYFLNANEVKRIVVKETKKTTEELSRYENDNMPPGVIMHVSREHIVSYDNHSKDITKQVFSSAKERINSNQVEPNAKEAAEIELDGTKVFIVHGHDDLAKTETARFIEKMGFEEVVFARPGPLVGQRENPRNDERLIQTLSKVIRPLMWGKLANFVPIQAGDVAKAMIYQLFSYQEEPIICLHRREMLDLIKHFD